MRLSDFSGQASKIRRTFGSFQHGSISSAWPPKHLSTKLSEWGEVGGGECKRVGRGCVVRGAPEGSVDAYQMSV